MHLATEAIKKNGNFNIPSIPYRGTSGAINDALGGQITGMIDAIPSSAPHIAAGKLKALAVTTKQRARSLPNVPTVAETYPGFESVAWQAFYAPKGTPEPVVRRLHAEIVKAVNSPEVRAKMEASGAEVLASSPEELLSFMRADIQRWRELAQNLKLTFE